MISDSTLTDIVSERFDAGIRLGEQVAKDMTAVRIRPPMRMVVVGSPQYLASRPTIRKPQDPTGHDCINIRFLTHGGLYAWEFEKDGRELNVRLQGRLTFNSVAQVLDATLAGFGLAYLQQNMVAPHLVIGSLQAVLLEWSPPVPGYHLYCPNRRQLSPVFSLVVDAPRHTT